MSLILTGFSQDVDLGKPDQVSYFLTFEAQDGRSVRLPVLKETTEALVAFLYAEGSHSSATSENGFGEHELSEDTSQEKDPPYIEEGATMFPSTEEEVPSL